MFRFILPVSRSQILQHLKVCNGQQPACLSVYAIRLVHYKHPAEPPRLSCPSPDPPPPPPKDDKWVWITATICVLTGAFAVYAKGNPEVRDWLTITAPWFDDMIAVLFQEDYSYMKWASNKMNELKELYAYYTNLPDECYGPPVKMPGPCDPCEMRACYEKLARERAVPCENKPKTPPSFNYKDVCVLEKCVQDYEKTVMNTLAAARDLCVKYSKNVEKTLTMLNMEEMAKLDNRTEERKETVDFARKTSGDISERIVEIKRYIECGAVTGPAEKIKALTEKVDILLNNIKHMEGNLTWECIVAEVYEKQWQLVKESMPRYQDDIKSYYGHVNFDDKSPNIDGESMDFLLVHTLKTLNQLKVKLHNTMDALTTKSNRMYESLGGDEKKKKERDSKLNATLGETKKDIDKQYAEREKDLKAYLDKKHKDALEEQKRRLNEENDKKLANSGPEVQKRFDDAVARAVKQERLQMKNQKEELQAQLDIVEAKLEVRLKAERETKRAQKLWDAGAALLKATQKGEDLVRVDKELEDLRSASSSETSGDEDKLVTTLIKSIPKIVSEVGLVPESTLRKMYNNMEDVAMKVALVEETGASMPVYVLSWIQSALLFMKLNSMPQKEIDNPPKKDPITDLDTFELLQRARYYMKQGNIAAAMRYVSSLQGASKMVAKTWLDWARCLLQTRQAAEAIQAHASALCMKSL